jgi:hypothetical protein
MAGDETAGDERSIHRSRRDLYNANHWEDAMLVSRISRFANVCGSMLLLFMLATMGLLLMTAVVLKHLATIAAVH